MPGGTSFSVTCSRSPRFAGAFTLRQRMLNFVQNIQYYMMFEVMEPTWHVLEKNLKSVSSQSALTLKRLCANRPCLQRGGRWLRCQSLCRGSSAPGGGSQACTRVCNEAVWLRLRAPWHRAVRVAWAPCSPEESSALSRAPAPHQHIPGPSRPQPETTAITRFQKTVAGAALPS